MVVEDLDELVELRAPFLEVFGKLFASSLVCNEDTRALKKPGWETQKGTDGG